MAVKTAVVAYTGTGLRFRARAGSGHELTIDDATGDAGFRPAELVPLALAGCTAMDVVSILAKKRQPVTAYEVRVEGIQRDRPQPTIFTRIDVVHVVDGPAELDTEAVRRSIELSATRYCAVSGTLATGATEIHHRYLVRRPGRPDETAEVRVEGPFAGSLSG